MADPHIPHIRPEPEAGQELRRRTASDLREMFERGWVLLPGALRWLHGTEAKEDLADLQNLALWAHLLNELLNPRVDQDDEEGE